MSASKNDLGQLHIKIQDFFRSYDEELKINLTQILIQELTDLLENGLTHQGEQGDLNQKFTAILDFLGINDEIFIQRDVSQMNLLINVCVLIFVLETEFKSY